jgi:hypothetical protein
MRPRFNKGFAAAKEKGRSERPFSEAGKHRMRVLPRGCREDEQSLCRDVEEDIDALTLTGDESVIGDGIDRSCTPELDSALCEAGRQLPLQLSLRGQQA